VTLIDPSSEFSIGTIAQATSPSRRAAIASRMLTSGYGSTASAAALASRASSLKVPSDPGRQRAAGAPSQAAGPTCPPSRRRTHRRDRDPHGSASSGESSSRRARRAPACHRRAPWSRWWIHDRRSPTARRRQRDGHRLAGRELVVCVISHDAPMRDSPPEGGLRRPQAAVQPPLLFVHILGAALLRLLYRCGMRHQIAVRPVAEHRAAARAAGARTTSAGPGIRPAATQATAAAAMARCPRVGDRGDHRHKLSAREAGAPPSRRQGLPADAPGAPAPSAAEDRQIGFLLFRSSPRPERLDVRFDLRGDPSGSR